jgi:GntR family transcriptional regulator/MocR family aminotransferase
VPRTATPLNFSLSLDHQPGSAASRVSRALIEALADGQLQDGDRLPSTRTLAQAFGLARSAVVGGYEELTAAGFLAARPGGHTYVGPGAGAAARAGAFGAPLPPGPAVPTAFAAPAEPGRAEPAPPQPAPPQLAYDLRPGLADTRLISERDWARAMRHAASAAREAVGARPDGGPVRPSHDDLRRELARHLRRARGLAVDPADLFVFPSVTVALGAVTAVCGLAGTPVAFEDPGYVKARLALSQAGAAIRPIPVDDDGIQARHLRATDRAVYVTPAHQYPLGGRMPASRRAGLLAWAADRDALVLEDDYDGEFRYGVPPLPPLRSMPGGADHVIYLGTSAKVLSRSLRISWAVLPARFRDAMRQHLDRVGDAVSGVSAALLCAYLADGALARHQARALRTYSARQRHFVAACRELISGARALGIEAGLHVVLAFDPPFDDAEAAARLADAGLACLPLSDFYARPGPADRAGLVCGYSRLPETRALGAAQLIARVAAGLSGAQTTGRPESRSTLRTDGDTGVPGVAYSEI